MKNSIILLIGVIGILCSCSEVDVTDYSSDNFIQFAKAAKDSTVFSFAYDQTMSAGTVKLKLNCIANLSTENRTFGVRYRAEESTAQAGVDFVMPDEEQVLLANDSVAYLEIQLNKSDNVKAKDLLLVFEVTDNSQVLEDLHRQLKNVAAYAYRKNRVIVSNRLTQPAWWDDWHETNGLGSWSAKKYTLFMEETKVSDMTLDRDGGTMSYSEMRAYVLKFKYWLQEHPTTDEDGTPMRVAMRG